MATTIEYSADRTTRGRLTENFYPDESGARYLPDPDTAGFTTGRTDDHESVGAPREGAQVHGKVVFDRQELNFVDKRSRHDRLAQPEPDEQISGQPRSNGASLRTGAEPRSPNGAFGLELPDNPCLIPDPVEWSATVGEAEAAAITGADSIAGAVASVGPAVTPLIGLEQLNDISRQLHQCASRDEVFGILQSSLRFVFPTAEISVSTNAPRAAEPATPNSFVVPLTAKSQAPGDCRISRQLSPFKPQEIEFLRAVGQHAGAALELIGMTEERQRSFGSMIKALALTLDARDELTAGHSARVANYSTATARFLGLSATEQKLTYYAGLLHDYGKIGVRDDVLCKPGKLTPEEYEHIKQHPVYSFHILSRINFGEDLAAIPRIAGSHHERPDGLGYPRGLKRDDIHICARIIGVTDFFDALTAVRHYRQPLHPDEVLTMIEAGRDTQFDGLIIDAFRNYYEEEYRPRYERRQQQLRPPAAHAK